MKSPSKNISASLRGQSVQARAPVTPSVSEQRTGGPTMTVPGEGKVERPPGEPRHGDRCAAKFTEPMKRFGGG